MQRGREGDRVEVKEGRKEGEEEGRREGEKDINLRRGSRSDLMSPRFGSKLVAALLCLENSI